LERLQLSALSVSLQKLKEKWSKPVTGSGPLSLVCRIHPGVDPALPSTVLKLTLPSDLLTFWSLAGSAELFLDVAYGQWGLRLLSVYDAENETALAFGSRPSEFRLGDLVIGLFVGDTDTLIIRCDPSESDFGCLIACNAITRRADWHRVSNSMSEFLAAYEAHDGDKFWEASSSRLKD
jgi:hypothetical protein